MSDRYDCVVPRKYKTRDGSEKTAWTKIGVAFPTQQGGYRVTLEALPLSQIGRDGNLECTFLLMTPKGAFEPKSKGGPRRGNDNPDDFGDPPF